MPRGKTEEHSFYCLGCGKAGIPLMRPISHKREKFHRKKLYCPYCGCTINHIECTNPIEVMEFKLAFKNGEFIEEAENSKKECAENEKIIFNDRPGRIR